MDLIRVLIAMPVAFIEEMHWAIRGVIVGRKVKKMRAAQAREARKRKALDALICSHITGEASKLRQFTGGGAINPAAMSRLNGGRTGLMGEAGPEAIMPLRRGPNGSLGVHVDSDSRTDH